MEEQVIEIVEILRSDQAVYISIMVMIVTGIFLFLYKKRLEKFEKDESLNIRYQFSYPQEKALYEKKLLEEPDPDDFTSTAVFERKKAEWTKDISSLLMKRAIMSISLSAKVSKDYSSYYMIYKSGINLDIWQSVQKAKELVEKELKVIQQEAEWLKPGWGKLIFQQANQLRMHMIMKQQQHLKEQKASAATAVD